MKKTKTTKVREREDICTSVVASLSACVLSSIIAANIIPQAQAWRISTNGTSGIGGEIFIVAIAFIMVYIIVTKAMNLFWKNLNSQIEQEKRREAIKATFNKEMLALTQRTCVEGIAEVTAEGHVFFKTTEGFVEEYPSVSAFMRRLK